MSNRIRTRVAKLIARDGVLSQILEEYNFPTGNHREVIESLCEEIVDELNSLGVSEAGEEPTLRVLT